MEAKFKLGQLVYAGSFGIPEAFFIEEIISNKILDKVSLVIREEFHYLVSPMDNPKGRVRYPECEVKYDLRSCINQRIHELREVLSSKDKNNYPDNIIIDKNREEASRKRSIKSIKVMIQKLIDLKDKTDYMLSDNYYFNGSVGDMAYSAGTSKIPYVKVLSIDDDMTSVSVNKGVAFSCFTYELFNTRLGALVQRLTEVVDEMLFSREQRYLKQAIYLQDGIREEYKQGRGYYDL